jgi:hypothetical protein
MIESEDLLLDQAVHCRLSMLGLHLPEREAHSVAVVAATELELGPDELAGTLERHHPSSNGASFFSTATFLSVTYFGNPFSNGG